MNHSLSGRLAKEVCQLRGYILNKMVAETTDKLRKRHTGRNVQRVRMYFGVKQEALAADLGISQNKYVQWQFTEEISGR